MIIGYLFFLTINILMTFYLAKKDGFLNPISLLASFMAFIGTAILAIICLHYFLDKRFFNK